MANVKAKTFFACDTCRRRKTRCDGGRPICDYCRSNNLVCAYRPLPAQLETDISILARLSEAEARIAVLEAKGSVTTPAHGSIVETCQDSGFVQLPNLHTAAAYKMLNCWPRLRLQLTIPGVHAMTYLKSCEDVSMSQNASPGLPNCPTIAFAQAALTFNLLFDHIPDLPFPMRELVCSSPLASAENALASFSHPTRSMEDETDVALHEISVPYLLFLSLALHSTATSGAQLARTCLNEALQRHWTLHSEEDQVFIQITLLMVACLIHYWPKPFHALGLLQSVYVRLIRFVARSQGHQHAMQAACMFTRIYNVLESDLLSEIDGFPCFPAISLPDSPGKIVAEDSDFPISQSRWQLYGAHLYLRGCLNRILVDVYSPEKAYAQPFEIAHLVQRSSAELRAWYRQLPIDKQFVRDLATFSMSVSTTPLEEAELALRYFSCVFLLHRPVLYFYLHKKMEFSVRPPDDIAANSSSATWVLESCCDCIETAVLIILVLKQRFEAASGLTTTHFSWLHVQLLFAVYLVILQVKAVPVLEQVARRAAELDDLLDAVERMFENIPYESAQVRTSLEILRNERGNFDINSPSVSMGSQASPFT